MSILKYAMVFLALLFVLVGCEKDYSFRGDAGAIAFSADTLSFDTVFTGGATITTTLRVYNTSGRDMTLDRIRLRGGEGSMFNVNINGSSTTQLSNVRLAEDDSLFVFVNVRIAESSEAMPFVVEDEIIVESNGNSWAATLVAYGQNTVRIAAGELTHYTWTAGMPYLVEGAAEVAADSTLTIDAGTKVYFSENGSLNVFGTLTAAGTRQQPILFKSSRLDAFYDDIPGQWGAITLMTESKRNTIEFSEIANGTYCVVVDSAATLRLRNVVLRDASRGAVLAYGADVDVANALMYNCGGSLVDIYGGRCMMNHCTLSNYYNWEARRKATLCISGETKYPALESVVVANSIVVGTLSDELSVDSVDIDKLKITHSLMRLKRSRDVDGDERLDAIVVSDNAKFTDREKFNFHLSDKSEAIDVADIDYAQLAPLDFDGASRIADATPDMGAFEYVEKITE